MKHNFVYIHKEPVIPLYTVAYLGNLSGGGGVQQIKLWPEGRENGNLGAVAP
jgi:hypothetical protein